MTKETATMPEELLMELEWVKTNSGEYPYICECGLREFEIRINDFPEEPLYTLLENGKALCSFSDWPKTWRKKS